MRRKRLAELVREEAEVLAAPQAEAAIPEAPTQEEAPEPPPQRTPKYLTYVRKECRLRPDQLDALTALARKLSRERKNEHQTRITENTLIRIAVDLLLARSRDASFSEEIRKAIEEQQP